MSVAATTADEVRTIYTAKGADMLEGGLSGQAQDRQTSRRPGYRRGAGRACRGSYVAVWAVARAGSLTNL